MKFISHRGNTDGSMSLLENTPKYIDIALKKYDCEIDIWVMNNNLYLTHDEPVNDRALINLSFLDERRKKLWIHCKNLEALSYFKKYKTTFNYFFHNYDQYTITSKGFIWANINQSYNEDCIIVQNEIRPFDSTKVKPLGICSDYVDFYYKKLV